MKSTNSIGRAAMAAFGAAIAALALPMAAQAGETRPAGEPTPSAAPVKPNSKQRYCVIVPAQTGSYLNQKICRTRAVWLEHGFDPLAPK